MTRKELATLVANEMKMQTNAVEEIIDAINNQIVKAVAEGDTVYMRGFGCYKSKVRKAKLGQNIKRGGTVQIPARRVPVFKPYKPFLGQVKL